MTDINSKIVGDKSVAIIVARLLELGYGIALPFGDSHRYDLIVDNGSSLLRVQCKTARMENGCVIFNTCSITTRNGKQIRKEYSPTQIDYLLAYLPPDKIFCLPASEICKSSTSLRINPAKNSFNYKTTRWAKDFEFVGFNGGT